MSVELSETLSNIVENTGKSVVRVEGGGRRSASGIVWSPKQVVTVAHAIQREDVTVSIDGKDFKARLKGRDENTDLALLELDEALAPATFDDGAGLKVGQLALRLARPGETVRATSGIVSALARKSWRTPRGAEVDFYLESDADYSSGFGGGPLVDLQGRVLGLTSTGVLRSVVLTIPTKTIRRVVAQFEAHGKVRRSHLGLQLQPVQLPDAVRVSTGEEIGLLVTSVEKDGPADKAGIQYGDTVLHLGDDSVKTLQDLYRYLRADNADKQVPLRFFRNGQVNTSQVTLGGR
ncbi:MAG: trypsin-like peptidase domain-containing protein [Archangium sp.]|nr:trypsin-like peptidase domain-containing protein [Archangium sp.]MDP3152887.1 trypsin-like peptidase domain-containing protein [Archangium sp.]MDP3569046.1 trypsin-like peptidase domain-containing protein [Archangium sp.]